ncbi:MAG: FtsX-like permease family protein, partial [Myxococcota bacterium]
ARALVVTALAAALARPAFERTHHDLTVVGLIDISGSVRRFADPPPLPDAASASAERAAAERRYIDWVRGWFDRAADGRGDADQFGLVVFDGDAITVLAPTRSRLVEPTLDVRRGDGTSIEEAIRLGLALLPSDTTGRLVLVSDGNETTGQALDAVRAASAGGSAPATSGSGSTSRVAAVPIDVLPIVYRVDADVAITDVSAPATAQPGQIVDLRVSFDARNATTGRLAVSREDEPVDLNGGDPGSMLDLRLPAGKSVRIVPIRLGTTPVNRLLTRFVPDDPAADELAENNTLETIVATPGAGSVLIVRASDAEGPRASAAAFETLLRRASLASRTIDAADLPVDLLQLQNHDLIVLDNVPAATVSLEAQVAIARHVEQLGGGLLMLGGTDAFGAGGWAGSPLAEVLPLDLDPPPELILPYQAWFEEQDQQSAGQQSHYRLETAEGEERQLGEALQRGRAFLLLSGTIGVLLAGLAMALASHRYAQRLTDQVALMKAWGQSANAIRRSQLVRLVALTVIATLIGIALGWMAHWALLGVAREFFSTTLPVAGWRPWLVSMVTGLACVLGFALPALWHLPTIAPLRVLRRDLDTSLLSQGMRLGIGVAALFILSLWYSQSLFITGMFLASLGALFLICGIIALQMLRFAKSLGAWRGSFVRLGLSNLWRRRGQTMIQLVGFTVTLMLLLVVTGLRTNLIAEWQAQLPDDMPTHFVFNVGDKDLDQVKGLLDDQSITHDLWYPMVRGRMVGINGEKI